MRYDNRLAEMVMVNQERGYKHEMKTWLIYDEKKATLNKCQKEDEHLDLIIKSSVTPLSNISYCNSVVHRHFYIK